MDMYGVLNPKLILDYIEDGEKSWDELMDLLGDPNPNWLHFHLKVWRNKGLLEIIKKNETTIIRKITVTTQ